MYKNILKHTTSIFEKLGVAGVAVGLFQNKLQGLVIGLTFIVISYLFAVWEARS